MTELDERLRDYHRSLVDGFAGEASRIRPRSAAEQGHGRRRRRLAFGAAVVALAAAAVLLTVRFIPSGSRHTVTLQVPGFTIVAVAASDASPPHLSRVVAERIAYAELARGNLNLSGFAVTSTTYAAGVISVNQTCGAHIGMATPRNVWVVALQAPPQARAQFVRAAVLIDDDTGEIAGGQVLTGPSPSGPLATCHWGT